MTARRQAGVWLCARFEAVPPQLGKGKDVVHHYNKQTNEQEALVKSGHPRDLEVFLVSLTRGTPKSSLRLLSCLVPTLTQDNNLVNSQIKTPYLQDNTKSGFTCISWLFWLQSTICFRSFRFIQLSIASLKLKSTHALAYTARGKATLFFLQHVAARKKTSFLLHRHCLDQKTLLLLEASPVTVTNVHLTSVGFLIVSNTISCCIQVQNQYRLSSMQDKWNL